jgi:putative membrane-bound dehydrogenase-like protein
MTDMPSRPAIALPALLAAAVAVRAADNAPAPMPADKAAAAMKLPPGFRATVFAAEPAVVQPISFCIDARGRLWVAEAFNYGAWQPTGRDRIVILEDRDGDGRAESRKVFFEGLNYVTGIEVGFGGVWVMSPPGLYFIPDRDGDDNPDGPPQMLFDGIGHKESRHNLANGFTWGPDGWLYFGHGRTSPSRVGRPGTPPEKRILCDGGVCRLHPTRLVFENFADGTTNPWGVDFDDYGACFVSNCVNPHLFHMLPGGHYEPWRNRASSLHAYERLPTIADHLHYAGGAGGSYGDLRASLGTADTLAMGGGHAHCGTMIYLGDRFPDEYRNTVLMCNVHGRRVNRDLLRRKGSGYTAAHGPDFLVSADPWFMGVTLRTGPDGSVFVSDWSDTGECHTYKPHTDNGRIYKITCGDPPGPAKDLSAAGDLELAALQLHRNDTLVRTARRLLQERAAKPGWSGTEVHARLRETLSAPRLEAPPRLRALWALHVTGGLDAPALTALPADRDEHVRGWAVRLLCEAGAPSEAALAGFARLAREDPSPVVRLELASALQRLPNGARWPIAEGLAARAEDATDANLPLMIWYGIEPAVAEVPARGLTLAASARIPLLRRFIARRIADAAAAKGRDADLSPLVAAAAAADPAVRADLLAGVRDGIRGRKSLPMPAGWSQLYARAAVEPAAREDVIALALTFGDPAALADLRAVATDRSAPAARRIAAVETLVENRPPTLAPLLEGLLSDPAVRRTALRGLGSVAHDDTPARILAVYPQLTAEEKPDAVAALTSRPAFALALLEAVERKAVPVADVSAYAARQMHALGDAAVSDRLKRVWGEIRSTAPDRAALLAKYRKQLSAAFLKKGDASAGRAVFAKACGNCHKLFGEGGAIGPDLTGGNRRDPEYVLSNLVDPGAEVARDYRMSLVRTADGQVLTGILLERSANRLVLQTATAKVVLSADDVDAVKDSPLSIMPEGLAEAMTKEELRDLITYLASPTQVPLK